MSDENIITQVSQDDGSGFMQSQDEMLDDYNTEIRMNMRGHMFTITRDDLMALPESVLLCLFPNGIFVGLDGNVISNLTDNDVVYVNFSPECFQYICRVFDIAVRDLNIINQLQNGATIYDVNDPNILNERPAIIVLREDLDYYCIPPKKNMKVDEMRRLKYLVGEKLQENWKIFDGLGYVAGKQLRPAEQHLMDMLCNSGFSTDQCWGHRSLEPKKTVIFSLMLARLNNGTHQSANATPTDSPSLGPVDDATDTENEERGRHKEKRRSRLSTLAQSLSRAGSRVRQKNNPNNTKLLLFWRKPARKCWWSDCVVDITMDTGLTVQVHVRRVWTLELSIIGMQ